MPFLAADDPMARSSRNPECLLYLAVSIMSRCAVHAGSWEEYMQDKELMQKAGTDGLMHGATPLGPPLAPVATVTGVTPQFLSECLA